MSRLRNLLLEGLRRAFRQNKLQLPGSPEAFASPQAFSRWRHPLRRKEWVVYAKPPFAGPQQVLEYLGRYTHRVAISNQRLVAFDGQAVTFQYKDYRRHDPSAQRIMTIQGEEFIRRSLLHSLPPGFQRIRHYGILASSRKSGALALAPQLLRATPHPIAPSREQIRDAMADLLSSIRRCPVCAYGAMVIVEVRSRHGRTLFQGISMILPDNERSAGVHDCSIRDEWLTGTLLTPAIGAVSLSSTTPGALSAPDLKGAFPISGLGRRLFSHPRPGTNSEQSP